MMQPVLDVSCFFPSTWCLGDSSVLLGVSEAHLHLLLKSLLSKEKFAILVSSKDRFHNGSLFQLWLLSRPPLTLYSVTTTLLSNAQFVDHVQQGHIAGAEAENHRSQAPFHPSHQIPRKTEQSSELGREEMKHSWMIVLTEKICDVRKIVTQTWGVSCGLEVSRNYACPFTEASWVHSQQNYRYAVRCQS